MSNQNKTHLSLAANQPVESTLCSEDEIRVLVHSFYAEVRRDPELGPIFNQHVKDWDAHLVRLVDFWSSLLRKSTRFAGSPMTQHNALPELDAALFKRWLVLFRATTARQPNQAMGEQANVMAQRIAQSLWFGYQLQRTPDIPPQSL